MKYISIDVTHGKGDGELTKRLIVAFPEDLIHVDMAQVVEKLAKMTFPRARVAVRSAGFVTVAGKCHGASETLGLKSDPEVDTMCFNSGDYGGNYI